MKKDKQTGAVQFTNSDLSSLCEEKLRGMRYIVDIESINLWLRNHELKKKRRAHP